MKNLTLVIITFLLCSTQFVSAQSQKITIDDYKLPDVKYRSLDLDFGMNGQNYKSEQESISYDNKREVDEDKTNDFHWEIRARYSAYKNTRKVQKDSRFYFNSSLSSSKITQKEKEFVKDQLSSNIQEHGEKSGIDQLWDRMMRFGIPIYPINCLYQQASVEV